ncbi:Aldehyde dehydrogenase [Labilithrix luteola]|uniref:Aldehyde dehydrogenase n=1 Tax=Labilithrix luteola TaxID=1391654 RepID=A0A0K1Q004_9BACT|nr:3,4-dehydroadipyl-CoA semialdehyde dehydrogenase [Labilithrix luteola]AKU98971.1 Aldehyde dehydrogenase [Labilithrix luteola]
MIELGSYVSGTWIKGKGKAAELVNPATEEVLAVTSTEGLDFGAAIAFARDKGGPALRAMTFTQRGEMLRAMSRAIHAKRDELLNLAQANGGNTRGDAKFDVDGAIGTLAAYADLAQELGDTHVLVDGDGIQLGRSARLFGQHVSLPREGVAVHVNAFNFPAWGLAEKAATALLAGMPVISKPATSTALVTHRIVEILVAEKLMPEGVLSLVCGGAGDMLDRLGGQDVIAFTGSSITAAKLREGKSVLLRGTKINVEADSLNSAVLGADVEEGSDVMNLFVGDVVREMTQKTGQKCTATRRIYVPKDKVGAVIELLRERLSAIKVGDPTRDDVTMGPVATASQIRDLREGVKKLESCAKIVFGGATDVNPIGVPAGKGYFTTPVLLHGENPKAGDAVHEHEVFGPVATVMPYESAASAASLVAAGGGGLVSSVYSDDKDFIRTMIVAVAPHHGRLTIGSSKIAGQALPPGMALPQLLHGGPGRAGGGEELGGRRGMALYMQRTALQGDRAIIEGLSGKK